MFAVKESVAITTDASGDGTGYTANVTGRILAIVYAKTDYANGIDFTVTLEGTGQAVMVGTNVNASAVFYPRAQVHDATGAGLTYDGTRVQAEPVVAVADRVKIVVAQGGSVKAGTFTVIVG